MLRIKPLQRRSIWRRRVEDLAGKEGGIARDIGHAKTKGRRDKDGHGLQLKARLDWGRDCHSRNLSCPSKAGVEDHFKSELSVVLLGFSALNRFHRNPGERSSTN